MTTENKDLILKKEKMQTHFNRYLEVIFEVVENENEPIQERKLNLIRSADRPNFCSEKDFIQEKLDDFKEDIKLHFGHCDVRKVQFFYEEGSPEYYSDIFSAIAEVYSDVNYTPISLKEC